MGRRGRRDGRGRAGGRRRAPGLVTGREPDRVRERPGWNHQDLSGERGRTGLERITDGPADGSPAWSPDGTRIAFASGRAGKPEFLSDYARGVRESGRDPIFDDPRRPIHPAKDIYVMLADGSGAVRLTDDPSDNIDPAWSPDGTRIAFSSVRDGDYELYVMGADGSDVTVLTDIPHGDTDPSWVGGTGA